MPQGQSPSFWKNFKPALLIGLALATLQIFSGFAARVTFFTSEILIDNDVIWSSDRSTPPVMLSLNVGAYTGKHRLKFRIRRTS